MSYKKTMLIGKQSAGKTTLIQRIRGMELVYRKTQALIYDPYFLDSPGEYVENKKLLSALLVSSADYDLIAFVQQADDINSLFPPGLSSMFNKPAIGIVTKMDIPDRDVSRVRRQLELAGAGEIFLCSAYTGEGVGELMEFLEK